MEDNKNTLDMNKTQYEGTDSSMDQSERKIGEDENDSGELFPQLDQQLLGDDSSGSNRIGAPGDSSFQQPESRSTNSLLIMEPSDRQSAEEKDEDFLIQQTAQRFSEAQAKSRRSTDSSDGLDISSAMFRRMSSKEAPSLKRKSWRDENHKEHRELMKEAISQLLRGRKEVPPSEDWLKQLPSKTAKLERRLYLSAPSLDAYLDKNTLQDRLKKVANEIVHEYNRRKSAKRRSGRVSSTAALHRDAQSNRTVSTATTRTDSLRSLQSSKASFTPRNSVVSGTGSSILPPASVATKSSNGTSSDREASLKQQLDSIASLEAKIKEEISRQEDLEKKKIPDEPLPLLQMRDDSLLQARLQLQQTQQLQQEQLQQQQFANQAQLLSLQPYPSGIGHLRSGALPSLSDLMPGRSLQQQSSLSALLAQQGTTQNHLSAQHLILQQQQQQLLQQQHRQSLELRLMSQLTNGSTTSGLAQRSSMTQQGNVANMNNNDAPFAPEELDRFWDG